MTAYDPGSVRPITRKVVKVVGSTRGWGLSRDVQLSCGHTAYTSAMKRARCHKCERDRWEKQQEQEPDADGTN